MACGGIDAPDRAHEEKNFCMSFQGLDPYWINLGFKIRFVGFYVYFFYEYRRQRR